MYYQSSARPNDPSEPEADRLKTLLDNLNNLRGKLKNFTVIDELGQPIGEINDLILDAGHQLNLVIAQPDAQERQSSVLLNGRRIKKVSVQTQSVFVDITKADVRFLPEYLLPDEAPAAAPIYSDEAPTNGVTHSGLNLVPPMPELDTPDFSLDVMESSTATPDLMLSQELQDEDDLNFLGLDDTASETDAIADEDLPNEARSLDEFSLLDTPEATSEDLSELPDFDLGSDATSAELTASSYSQDSSDEWDEFDRIMATDPTEAAGTLDLDSNMDAFGDSNPVPESFALVEPEPNPLQDVFRLDDSVDLIETASRLASDATPESTIDEDWASLGSDSTEPEPSLNLSSASDLPELNLEATDNLDLSFDASPAVSSPDLTFGDDLSGLSFDAPPADSSPDLTFDDDLPGLSVDAPPAESSPDLTFDDDLPGLSFDTSPADSPPDLTLDDNLSSLGFDDPAPALDLSPELGNSTESNLVSEWADFDREMETPSAPVDSNTDLDFANLELPEEAVLDLDLEASLQSDERFGEPDLAALNDTPSPDFTDTSLDFNDALSFVESEETTADFAATELVSDANAIAFTADAETPETELETISSLADLDFEVESAPPADFLSPPSLESPELVIDPVLGFDLDAPETPLDLSFDQPDALGLSEPQADLDFSLEQPELVEANTDFNLSIDQPAATESFDLGLDAIEPEAALDLSFDQPNADTSLDFGFDQSEPSAALDLNVDSIESDSDLNLSLEPPAVDASFDLGLDQPESEAGFDLELDQPESEASFDLGLDAQPAAETAFDLELEQPSSEPTFDLGLNHPEADLALDFTDDQAASGDALDLRFAATEPNFALNADQAEPSDSLDLGFDLSESTADLTLNQPDAEAAIAPGLDLPTPPSLNLVDLDLSSTPIELPEATPLFAEESSVAGDATPNEAEFGLASIPAETFDLTESEVVSTDLAAPAELSESTTSLPIDSVDAIVPLLEERLKVEYERRKVGEIIVRKRIETRMVQVPVRYEKLIIEQVGEESKTLAEVDLSQDTLDSIELSGVAGKPIVSGEFKSPKTASYVLDAIAKTLQHRCKNVRIEIELDDPKLQKAYQDWLNQCSQM